MFLQKQYVQIVFFDNLDYYTHMHHIFDIYDKRW